MNYLARLGWSHGDDEISAALQFLEWFNLDHLGRSAAQFDEAKLRWVFTALSRLMDDGALAELVAAVEQKGRGGRRAPVSHLRLVQRPL
ncbi:MAG: hypothetical protein R3E42_08600 [Burkholderiaceae bacterium]